MLSRDFAGQKFVRTQAELCEKSLAFLALLAKFVSCCAACWAKSYKNRVVIFPHKLTVVECLSVQWEVNEKR